MTKLSYSFTHDTPGQDTPSHKAVKEPRVAADYIYLSKIDTKYAYWEQYMFIFDIQTCILCSTRCTINVCIKSSRVTRGKPRVRNYHGEKKKERKKERKAILMCCLLHIEYYVGRQWVCYIARHAMYILYRLIKFDLFLFVTK